MTQEEYEQELQEIEYLINEINRLVDENNELVRDINMALSDINILQHNVVELHNSLEPRIRGVSGEVTVNSKLTESVRDAIAEMTTQYFTFKVLSSASKNVTQYTDEYYTRFSYYNSLRRVTLGYVIGLDNQFVSSEKMRNIVEKAYLQNSEYWLAYAAMALMLWASDEREAAYRALNKALFKAPQKTSLFFMLVNLRFSRNEVAQQWFVDYMTRVNPSNLGEEWQYLLQAYLAGAFGENEEFQMEVSRYFRKMLVQSEATTADFSKRFIDRAYAFADTWLHRADETYAYLKGTCADYPLLMDSLSCAQKNAQIARFYDRQMQEEAESGDIYQRIENVLYDLISSYDDDELEVVKKIKLNEHILSAKGDQVAAQKKFDMEFRKQENKNFADLMTDWAFAQDSKLTPLSVRRFSIAFMKEWIGKGYEKYAQDYRSREKESYIFKIDECEIAASENDFEAGKETLETYYEKNKWKSVIADKFTKIYGLISVAGLATLIFLVINLVTGNGFNRVSQVALTLGLLLLLVGGFLLWRNVVSVLEQWKEQMRLSIQRFGHALEELGEWRQLYHKEDTRLDDLLDALRRFGSDWKEEEYV